MTFLRAVPANAVFSDDNLQARFTDSWHIPRIANRVTKQVPRVLSATCRVNGELHVKKERNKNPVKSITTLETYEGRKNLSFVEIELCVSYMETMNGWISA